MLFDSISLTDDFIEKDQTFLEEATDIGFLQDGWQDRVDFLAL